MTDRHSAYVVTLESNVREDDAEQIITALRQVRGVIDVRPVVSDLLAETAGRQRADSEWRKRLGGLLTERGAGGHERP